MLDFILKLADSQGAALVALLILSTSNMMLIYYMVQMLRKNKDDSNKVIKASIDQVKDEISKHHDSYQELHSKLIELSTTVNSLYENIERSESTGSISQIKKDLDKIRENIIEIKAVLSSFIAKGGKS